MEFRQLKYFLSVVESGSFTRAAARIHIVQPALSRQIRSLEEELGTSLLIRHGRGVVLTEEGERFKDRAEALLRQFDRLTEEVNLGKQEPAGEINLGMPPSMRSMLTTRLVIKYRRRYPKVFIKITEGVSAALRDGVTTGQLDLACIVSLEPTGSLERVPVLTQPMCLVGPEGSGFTLNKPISIRKAASYPLMLTSYPNGLRLVSQNLFSKKKITPNIVLELNSLELISDFVRAGLGFTLVPQSSIFDILSSGKLEAAPVSGMNVTWILVSSSERFQPIAVKRMISMLKEEIAEVVKDKKWTRSEDKS